MSNIEIKVDYNDGKYSVSRPDLGSSGSRLADKPSDIAIRVTGLMGIESMPMPADLSLVITDAAKEQMPKNYQSAVTVTFKTIAEIYRQMNQLFGFAMSFFETYKEEMEVRAERAEEVLNSFSQSSENRP